MVLCIIEANMKTQIFLLTTLISCAALADPAPTEQPVTSYFRFDQDYMFGTQLWAGATYPLIDGLGISADIYVPENYPGLSVDQTGTAKLSNSWWGEFDIGPSLTLGPLTVTPMAGIAFDWAAKKAIAINAPQLYTVINFNKIYFESWWWTVLYSPLHNPVYSNYFHTRNWVLYKISKVISAGPQMELMYNLNTQGYGIKGLTAAPLGGHVELAFGTGNSLGLFLGYEMSRQIRTLNGSAADGRLTFVHNF
jgi:hypothetical protein